MSESFVLNHDITEGAHSVLFERIETLSASDMNIQAAYEDYFNTFKPKSFSALDILLAAEMFIKDKTIDKKTGNYIYAFDNTNVDSSFIKNSIPGIYGLVSYDCGASIDIDAIGGSVHSGESKRFLIVSSKKADKCIKNANKENVKLIKAGEILSQNELILNRSGNPVEIFDKSVLNNCSGVKIALNSCHFAAYLSGYRGACSYNVCDRVSDNNVLRFEIDDGIENVISRALGFYSAAVQNKISHIRYVFASNVNTSVAVQRPNVADGDYYYLLKVRIDEKGIPDKVHYSQLCYYLNEKRRDGVIKNVLPLKENIEGVLKRLGNEKLVYESLGTANTDGFGIAVCVPRGESVNGIKLGYFKNI